jgi:hypothetical protein
MSLKLITCTVHTGFGPAIRFRAARAREKDPVGCISALMPLDFDGA